MMWIVVAYDVSTDDKAGLRRLRRVAKICEQYGQRVQKSLFECKVDELTYLKLRTKLLREIDEQQDSLRIYRIREPKEENIEEFGTFRAIDYDDPLIV